MGEGWGGVFKSYLPAGSSRAWLQFWRRMHVSKKDNDKQRLYFNFVRYLYDDGGRCMITAWQNL